MCDSCYVNTIVSATWGSSPKKTLSQYCRDAVYILISKDMSQNDETQAFFRFDIEFPTNKNEILLTELLEMCFIQRYHLMKAHHAFHEMTFYGHISLTNLKRKGYKREHAPVRVVTANHNTGLLTTPCQWTTMKQQ